MQKGYKSILFTGSAVLSTACLLMIFLSTKLDVFAFASEYIMHIMLIYIGLGLVALSFDQKRIMVMCLLSSALIAFYLKMASNPDLIIAGPSSDSRIKVSLIDLKACEGAESFPLKTIKENQAHIISFQHYNEYWNNLIQIQLYKTYPYIYKWHPSEEEGLAIYSSVPFDSSYTLNFDAVPNAVIDFNFENQIFHLVSSYFPFEENVAIQDKSALLDSMAAFINELDGHVLNLGHYNEYYWSRAIIEYRKLASLENSRRQIDWQQGKVPQDHIFHSDQLRCISLEELYTDQKIHVGLHANYVIEKSRSRSLTMN